MNLKTLGNSFIIFSGLKDLVSQEHIKWVMPDILKDYNHESDNPGNPTIVFEWGYGQDKNLTLYIEGDRWTSLWESPDSTTSNAKEGKIKDMDINQIFDLYKWWVK